MASKLEVIRKHGYKSALNHVQSRHQLLLFFQKNYMETCVNSFALMEFLKFKCSEFCFISLNKLADKNVNIKLKKILYPKVKFFTILYLYSNRGTNQLSKNSITGIFILGINSQELTKS